MSNILAREVAEDQYNDARCELGLAFRNYIADNYQIYRRSMEVGLRGTSFIETMDGQSHPVNVTYDYDLEDGYVYMTIFTDNDVALPHPVVMRVELAGHDGHYVLDMKRKAKAYKESLEV